MLNQTSEKFRAFFLYKFTELMIQNSEPAEVIAIKENLRQKIKQNIEKKENEKRLREMVEKKKIIPKLREITEQPTIKEKFRTMRKIKPYKIPETIKDILPIPSGESIDLGKLNPFISDPTIRLIECNGIGKTIVVKRIRGETRTTNVKLDEEEIIGVIKAFSEKAKIPFEKGTFKAAVGKLIISAIISDIISSKFIITKIPEQRYFQDGR